MKVLIAYDGSLDSKAALKYGIQKVREYGGELIALHVFPRHLFIDYDAGPRAEEIAKRESFRHMEDARTLIRENGRGILARIVLSEGNLTDETLRYSKEEDVDLIVAPPRLDRLVEKACCLTDIVSAREAPDVPADAHPRRDEIVETGTWRSP